MLTDPYAIFAAARQYWQTAVYPKNVAYGITVTVERGGVTSHTHYHASYDAEHNVVSVNPDSDEELAHPYTPHGINTFFNFFGGSIPMSAPQNTFDYLGVPRLAPNYSFGIVPSDEVPRTGLSGMDLVREIRKEFHDPFPPQRQQHSSDLKTIALVVVAHRQYEIRLAGSQPLGNHDDYDLVLKPIADPGTYRLREMWVNEATYATDRVVTDGNFTADELGRVRWQTDFTQVAGAPFITQETALSGFMLNRRHYDAASVAFTNIVPSGRALAPLIGTARGAASFATDARTAPPPLEEPPKPRT